MGLFKKLFGNDSNDVVEPDVRFGRYSDAHKAESKYDAWDQALDLFEVGKYKDSFALFFDYLLDESQDNIKTWEDDDGIHYELLQGSKVIKGVVGDKIITAEAKVAKAEELSIGFLRRMMELNYTLKYSRFALDKENNLTLIFDSYLLDGSPYKMYYALKEIAVSADKQDDLLVGEFKTLKPVNTAHVKPVTDLQREVKTKYLREEIELAFEFFDKTTLNNEQYAGGLGYLLLELAYRLDYLLKPEGELTEALERIHRLYFANDNRSSSEKNHAVRKEFEEILKRSDEELQSEMYIVSSTFGITSPSSHEQLVTFIDAELKHMDWYLENRHPKLALAFPGYIAGYSLFNYAYLPPVRELLHLYYRITESKYFEDLGFEPSYYDKETDALNKKGILNALEHWKDTNHATYPNLDYGPKLLDFTSLANFAKSYFLMVARIDTKKANA